MTKQVGGNHYKRLTPEPWDVMIGWFGVERFQAHCLMTALKYLAREKHDRCEDIEKAIHYLEKWVELEKSKQ